MSGNAQVTGSAPAPWQKPTGDFEARLAAFIGPRWEDTYERKLRPFITDPAFVPTWNWAAALLSPFWFLYRKLYLWFAVFYLVPGAVMRWLVPTDRPLTPDTMFLPENQQLLVMTVAMFVSSSIAAGGTGNWLLFRRARTAIRVIGMQPMPTDAAFELLKRVGGTNRTITFLFLGLSMVLLAGAMAGGA